MYWFDLIYEWIDRFRDDKKLEVYRPVTKGWIILNSIILKKGPNAVKIIDNDGIIHVQLWRDYSREVQDAGLVGSHSIQLSDPKSLCQLENLVSEHLKTVS